ncbi:TetR/AcrR family transcriptional regulator [Aeromicrobium sp.]|uniref:TetR/AcrR family transcriptional regulator n=1 Tax=Aeromicrobium sp. TaxID=1871063 RepID=UPI003D6ABBCF
MESSVKRSYDASSRQARALETRQRVIDVADDLFINQGYGRTTIADIARGAGVSVETVYSAFGNKAAVLRKVWYVRFRGDEQDVRLLDRPEIQEMLAEPDLVVRLRRHAVVVTPVFRRFVPLHRALEAAAASEPSAADMVAEFDAGRLDASTHYAKAARKTGQLVVSATDCRDIFSATLDGSLWHRLVHEGGWSDKRFATFLGELWVSLLT